MSEHRRMTSIARRVNRSFLLRMALTALAINALALVLALGAWCYTVEKHQYGEAWKPALSRSLEWADAGNFPATLSTVVYVVSLDGGEAARVPAGAYLRLLFDLSIVAAAFEAVMLLAQYGAGRKRTKRLLDPLYKMADAARQMLSERIDGQKYHDLENAISQISPSSPDARLQTGDRDLQGLEEAVNSLLSRMHDSYRQQIRFVSDASHELRTPISVIQGYAGMLDRWGKHDEKVLTEGIAAIRTETDHMQKLVEQLLFLARGDAGRNQLAFAPLDLSAMMREVFEEYDMIDDGHLWRFQAAGEVPALGDASLLKQTARILCDNARNYSPKGSPVTLRCFAEAQGIPCFSVQDNGEGIAQKDIPHIFERFFRADPARTRQSGGTGLGLSIARWIVDGHGGYFEVVSRKGVGTRITVCLPLKEAQAKAEALKAAPENGARAAGA